MTGFNMFEHQEKSVPVSLPSEMISRIEDIGRAKQFLKSILDDPVFDTLSKHNCYWDSEHDVEADKLDDARRKLDCIHDNLWNLYAILNKEE